MLLANHNVALKIDSSSMNTANGASKSDFFQIFANAIKMAMIWFELKQAWVNKCAPTFGEDREIVLGCHLIYIS